MEEMFKEEEEKFTADILREEEKEMIIYGNKTNILRFKESPYLFVDGTFSICPKFV